MQLPGQPVRRGTMAHEHVVCSMLADAAALAGDAEALGGYAAALEELAQRDQHLPYLAVSQRALGMAHRITGEHAQAEARLLQALEVFQAMGAGWQVGRTLVELAQVDLARSDNRTALGRLNQALEAFKALGAVPDVQRTERALAAIF